MTIFLMVVFCLVCIGWMDTKFKKLDPEPGSRSKAASQEAARLDDDVEEALRQVYQDQDAEWHRQHETNHQHSDRDL